MPEVQGIFFWFSGVLVPPRSAVLKKAISEASHSKINLSALDCYQVLNDQFTLGLMNDLEYCQEICDEMHLKIRAETIKEKILSAIIPNKSVYEIINLLPKSLQQWLIVDYPAAWFNQIYERLEANLSIPSERIIFVPNCSLKNISPDIFAYLKTNINVLMNECLFVDENPKRVIEAFNYGLPSIIFVDAQRLKREFILRKFIT
jgi:FMN phosphatase YigB (HAD superfamily)